MTRAARILGLTLLGLGVTTSALAQDPLQPYQMVRSLQLVQDRLASGDHAALPMQNKLLEMADARFRASKPDDFKEPRNLRALLVYGMSGGNPATVRSAAGRVQLDQTNQAIVDGILDYLGGQPGPAIAALQPIDPMTLSPDVGAFVALIKGSLLAIDDPVQALTLLDQARLLSPGTLVEEAALRRSVAIATTNGDAARFAQASTQYVERYLLSPYASQFADSFVAGVVTLHMALSQDKLADITSMMDTERERVIYLRIARRAAIDGLNDLSAFASTKAIPQDKGATQADDPRAELYASLSSITSATVDDIRAKLKTIDRSRLSPSDRSLLDAAQQITQEVVAPPIPAVFDRPLQRPPSRSRSRQSRSLTSLRRKRLGQQTIRPAKRTQRPLRTTVQIFLRSRTPYQSGRQPKRRRNRRRRRVLQLRMQRSSRHLRPSCLHPPMLARTQPMPPSRIPNANSTRSTFCWEPRLNDCKCRPELSRHRVATVR
ncbi:chemotaxis protein MotC [Mesorhizobium amorphae]|uniref:chemotaxis protein MotC n=1 Tax=Mesorhizobium amorphae TaxID=71433 RepID=UPI0021B3294B|nr:chemotaxis protein MotC [Mesorhizobium amorphae]